MEHLVTRSPSGESDNLSMAICRTKRHLLMWGHYTGNHQGALLEFDERQPCFRRDVASAAARTWQVRYPGLWGQLSNVLYADERAILPGPPNADRLGKVCLTKSLDWAYEQEVRLFWPLPIADDVKDGGIRLYSVPSSTLKSITFGCSSSPKFLEEARELLRAFGCTHVRLSRATPNPNDFAIDYLDM